MELSERTIHAMVKRTGTCEFPMAVTEDLEIKGNGQEILKAECPTGKQWKVSISVCIEETDL